MTKATPQELEALAAEILGDAAMTAPSIRETLEGLVEAVRRDADEGGKGISGYTSARLSDARAALSAPPQDVVEGIAETLWRAEYRRATGKERGIAWDDVAESDQNKYRHSATAILASGLVTAAHPDEAAIRADERERCAQAALGAVAMIPMGQVDASEFLDVIEDAIAAAIRAGGAK